MRLSVCCLLLASVLAVACDSANTAPEPGVAESGAYLALGDSLSAGIGASDPGARGFVALVHRALGPGFELLNMGRPGDTSRDLIDNALDDAVRDIESRLDNDDADDDVALITLEIGGNDLLAIYYGLVVTGTCPDLDTALTSDECSGPLATTLEAFDDNLSTILTRLRAAGPDTPLLLLTLYNPLAPLGERGSLADLALEGVPDTQFEEGVNDIIRARAGEHGAVVVETQPLFEGQELALVSPDFIHPNDGGYQAMANGVIAAIASLADR
jgi:lysophospholipase L1-like esterase